MYIKRPKSQMAGCKETAEHFSLDPAGMRTAPSHGQFLVQAPVVRPPDLPSPVPILVLRVDEAISVRRQNALLAGFDAIVDSGAVMHHRREIRSETTAFHFGAWEKFGQEPRLTEDTLHQNPTALRAIHQFMWFMANEIAPIYRQYLQRHMPEQLYRQRRYVD